MTLVLADENIISGERGIDFLSAIEPHLSPAERGGIDLFQSSNPIYLLRREGDSNPRTALDGYTLSRRASSATRASLLEACPPAVLFSRQPLAVSRWLVIFPSSFFVLSDTSPITATKLHKIFGIMQKYYNFYSFQVKFLRFCTHKRPITSLQPPK